MACSRFKSVVGIFIAGSMVVSSTGAIAMPSAAPAATSAAQINPWVALTAMSGGAAAAALCGAATVAAAAQTPGGCVLPAVDAPPAVATAPPQPIPVPPVEAPSSFAFDPLLLALGAVVVGGLLYLVLRNHHHANSPA
jgi:hypothetical protein